MTVNKPSDAVAARIREVRKRRGWLPADLARRCAELGADHLTENVIENIESGRRDKDGRRRRDVTVDELLVFAIALDISPRDLLIPPYPPPLWGGTGSHASDVARPPDDPNVPNDEDLYPVAPGTKAPIWQVRQFLLGWVVLPGMDLWRFFSEAPPQHRPDDEQIQKLIDSGPLKRWMTGG